MSLSPETLYRGLETDFGDVAQHQFRPGIVGQQAFTLLGANLLPVVVQYTAPKLPTLEANPRGIYSIATPIVDRRERRYIQYSGSRGVLVAEEIRHSVGRYQLVKDRCEVMPPDKIAPQLEALLLGAFVLRSESADRLVAAARGSARDSSMAYLLIRAWKLLRYYRGLQSKDSAGKLIDAKLNTYAAIQ